MMSRQGVALIKAHPGHLIPSLMPCLLCHQRDSNEACSNQPHLKKGSETTKRGKLKLARGEISLNTKQAMTFLTYSIDLTTCKVNRNNLTDHFIIETMRAPC